MCIYTHTYIYTHLYMCVCVCVYTVDIRPARPNSDKIKIK